jgi:hypothetical protein
MCLFIHHHHNKYMRGFIFLIECMLLFDDNNLNNLFKK